MIQFMQTIPVWFLIVVICILGFLFGRSMNHSFGKLDDTLDRFQTLIDELFAKHEEALKDVRGLDSRLSKLEGSHEEIKVIHTRRLDDLR